MQFIYLISFAIISFIILFLLILMKRQSNVKTNINNCGFKLSKPKIRESGQTKIATFNVYVKDYHKFFVEFPVLFRFYSNYRFRSKIKIGYYIPGDRTSQSMFDEELRFKGKTFEHKYLISDIILGKLVIEIECKIDYGNPIVCFEILENTSCTLDKEYKVEVKF